MKILLMDLDIGIGRTRKKHPFPNLALMKLSAYHKARGDEVYLNFPLHLNFDITYASCVFTWQAERRFTVPDGTIIGGSGIDSKVVLHPEVEHIMPDYDLYPNKDESMGFTSRGCIRRCPWCIVPEKEGSIKSVATIYEFWDRRHRKIKLLDNNLLASPNWRQTMGDLIAEGLIVDLNQGLDIRLVNDKNVEYLKKLKVGGAKLRFAFDHMSYEKEVRRGIEILLDNGIPPRRISFYLLLGFDGDSTIVERAMILQSYNIEIYPMPYKGLNGKEPTRAKIEVPDVYFHGSRRNINKFLRLVGRLPD